MNFLDFVDIVLILLVLMMIVLVPWLLYLDSLVTDLRGYIARMEREHGWPPYKREMFEDER